MRAGREDMDFVPDIDAAMRRSVNRLGYVLSFTVAAFVVVFLMWASVAALDEVTRGDAKIVPSSRVQVIQNLEGGILSELLVQEGAVVEKDDIILRITNTASQSDYRESRSQSLSLKAAVARLQAEVDGRPVEFPPDVLAQTPAAAASEGALFEARAAQLTSQVAVLRDQLVQRRQELVELRSRLSSLQRPLALAQEEMAILRPLVGQGVAARVELVRVQRLVADLDGQMENTRSALPRAEAAISEAERRIEELHAKFRAEARSDLNQRRAQLEALTEKIVAGEDRVTRTEVRSPVRGIVKEIKLNTLGGVIRPGQDLMEVVPLEDTLVVEARVRPNDIAFLHPGQPAMVKITAYDFSIYGGLKSRVELISPDTIENQKGESFFKVFLRTEKSYLERGGERLPIIPGMTAGAEIMTGKKTVLDYLLKPILKARDQALREK